MKKLELKNICSYLPYGLKIESPDGIVTVKGIDTIDDIFGFMYWKNDKREISFSTDCKPYLYSMDWLTKPITHNGETFVPIISMIESTNFFGMARNTPTDWMDGNWNISELVHYCEPCMCLQLFDKLSEWMFDYRDLIRQGLAIPVTEEFNPYK